MKGRARPLPLPFTGRRERVLPVEFVELRPPLTADERENIRAALIMETMEFESDKQEEFADD
jgi:hypothetical protein